MDSFDNAHCEERLSGLWGPYYLDWMGTNALKNRAQVGEVREAADRISDADALCLVRLVHWRPLVMGAWFAVRHPGPEIAAAVLTSLERSLGHLTSPPLAVSAVLLAGPAAMHALEEYHKSDLAYGYGASPLIEAAAGHLATEFGVASPLEDPSDRAAMHFTQMLDLGKALQLAHGEP